MEVATYFALTLPEVCFVFFSAPLSSRQGQKLHPSVIFVACEEIIFSLTYVIII